MKKLLTTALGLLAIGSLLTFVSCSDDDGEEEKDPPTNTFTFDGKEFEFSGGLVEDYGPADFFGDGATHYNYDFVSFDGNFDSEEESFRGSFYIYIELFSPGTSSFQAGTFSYMDSGDPTGEFFFNYGEVAYDDNDDSFVGGPEDKYFDITGGSVEAIDNGNRNYTLNYNLRFREYDYDTDEPIGSEFGESFSATLDYEYFDNSDERIAEKRPLFLIRK